MTREEAIKELKILKEDYWDDDGYGHETEQYDDMMSALDMAINSLEQEHCEDAVSRKAIEKLKRYRFSYDNNTTIPKSDLFVKLTDLRDLPSVTPMRNKGKWIPHKAKYDNAVPVYECSICHKNNGFDDDNFCPNCGAEMGGCEE